MIFTEFIANSDYINQHMSDSLHQELKKMNGRPDPINEEEIDITSCLRTNDENFINLELSYFKKDWAHIMIWNERNIQHSQTES